MSGLREKKKVERKLRIQNAAVKLFSETGFDNTIMESIAKEADLGVGTLYNYYESKGDILLSIIADRVADFIPEFQIVIKNHSTDIQSTINSFFEIYLKSFSFYNKVIWREFIANALARNISLIDYISGIDSVFISNLAELFLLYKNEGVINKDIDIEKAVLTLYSLIIFHIVRYISEEGMNMESMRESLKGQVNVVVHGLI